MTPLWAKKVFIPESLCGGSSLLSLLRRSSLCLLFLTDHNFVFSSSQTITLSSLLKPNLSLSLNLSLSPGHVRKTLVFKNATGGWPCKNWCSLHIGLAEPCFLQHILCVTRGPRLWERVFNDGFATSTSSCCLRSAIFGHPYRTLAAHPCFGIVLRGLFDELKMMTPLSQFFLFWF